MSHETSPISDPEIDGLLRKKNQLKDLLRNYSWFKGIGVGREAIIVYVSRMPDPIPFESFDGTPVEYVASGRVVAN